MNQLMHGPCYFRSLSRREGYTETKISFLLYGHVYGSHNKSCNFYDLPIFLWSTRKRRKQRHNAPFFGSVMPLSFSVPCTHVWPQKVTLRYGQTYGNKQ